ncbi:hypothetical protein PybrP1_006344 [[Pythium] brassicae (nom. inval.)]|nr:hypothetical protein PybrP1_006344 [[Pythium] brassicae (nom. inval.)]
MGVQGNRLSVVRPAHPEAQKQGRSSKFSEVPIGAWYVSGLNCVHRDLCNSVRSRSARQLELLRGLQGAILPGLDSSRVRVVRSLAVNDGVDVQTQPAPVYRAIRNTKARLQAENDSAHSYRGLPGFRKALEEMNTGTCVCCQLDDQGWFYRLVIVLRDAVRQQNHIFPVFEFDETHMKHSDYNGVC